MISAQTLVFSLIGLVLAGYAYSVIEHDDGIGKVCLILLVCLGVTLPVVTLNLNYDQDLQKSKEGEGFQSLTHSINKLMKETLDLNESLYLLQSLKKELMKTRGPKTSNNEKSASVDVSKSVRLDQINLGIVECVYKVLQTCEQMEDKRAVIGLEIISLLFEEELIRNQAFRDDSFARYCIEEHSQFIFRFIPVGLLEGAPVRNTLIIKAITVLTLMTINDPLSQDRFADKGIIHWILGSCFYSLSGENKSLINVGIYGLVALIKDNPGNKSELFRCNFIEQIEHILQEFSTSPNVCMNAVSILYILIENDPRQKYSTQQARQSILHSSLMSRLLEMQQRTDDTDLKNQIQVVLNVISNDLS